MKKEEIEKEFQRVDRVFGFVYLYLTRPVLEKLGMEGEKAIRKGLRAYGNFRGKRLRKWHTDEGLPINVESLLRYWDISSARTSGVFTTDSVFTPYYVEHPATHCILYDVCKEEDFEHYGYIYCDEIHQEICMAYHPKAIVEIHECLMKNDPRCHFKWMMIPEIPEEKIDKSAYGVIDRREREDPEKFDLFYLKRDANVVGLLYYFLADAIIKRFGEEGKKMVESALMEMGKRRGRELRDYLERAGIDITVRNAFDNFDLPYKYLWKMSVETSDGKFLADVEYCPLAELWNGLENKELGAMYCETMYKSMFKELAEGAEIKIPQCMTKGASKCRFEFKI